MSRVTKIVCDEPGCDSVMAEDDIVINVDNLTVGISVGNGKVKYARAVLDDTDYCCVNCLSKVLLAMVKELNS